MPPGRWALLVLLLVVLVAVWLLLRRPPAWLAGGALAVAGGAGSAGGAGRPPAGRPPRPAPPPPPGRAADAQAAALRSLDIDWSGLLAELGPRLDDDPPWHGTLGLDGKESLQSTLRPRLAGLARAGSLEAERLRGQPALMHFATVPQDRALLPGPGEVSAALEGRSHFADVLISRRGVLVHGPGPRLAAMLQHDIPVHRQERVASILGSLQAVRSRRSQSAETFADVARTYDYLVVPYPRDPYFRLPAPPVPEDEPVVRAAEESALELWDGAAAARP